jgi:hypothetical protein
MNKSFQLTFNALKLVCLLTGVITSASSQAQSARDYPLQTDSFSYKDAADYNALSIVQSIRNLGSQTRTSAPVTLNGSVIAGRGDSVWVEEARVIDSATLPQGKIVHILVPASSGKILFPFEAGKRYLVIATGQAKGAFVEPASRAEAVPDIGKPAASNEILGFAAFETHAARLSPGQSSAWRIANSVADTLIDSSDADLRRTLSWLFTMWYPGSEDPLLRVGRPDFEYAQRLRADITNPTAYRSAKVYQVLCRWKVFGMQTPFLQALIKASKDPAAWTATGDLLLNGDLNYGSPAATGDPNYQAITLNAETWTDAVLEAKSAPIRGYLLGSFDYYTTEEQNRRLAALLSDPDEGTQAQIVTHLSRNLKMPEKDVARTGPEQRFAWKNKDEVLSYWRSRYGIPGKP